MNRTWLALFGVAVLATSLSSGPARAETPTVPVQEPRLRVSLGEPTKRTHVGTLERITADSLTLLVGREQLTLVTPSVLRLELSQARSGNAGKGLLIGTVLGLGLGAGLGGVIFEDSMLGSPEQLGIMVGGLGGALIGTIVGAVIRTDHWKEIPIESFLVPPHVSSPSAGSFEGARYLTPGEHIRVRVPTEGKRPITGILREWTDSTIVIARGNTTRRLSPGALASLEVEHGSRGQGLLGGIIGFGVGFAAGVILDDPAAESGRSSLALGILATPIGIAVGSQCRSPRWTSVPLPVLAAQ